MQDQSDYVDMEISDLENIIQRAVAEQCAATERVIKDALRETIQTAVAIQRTNENTQADNAFRATEKRLYAYPLIKKAIESDRQYIQEIQQNGTPQRAALILRLGTPGRRLTEEEIVDAKVKDIAAKIAKNEYEIETIDNALTVISGDPYEKIINLKYFEGKTTEEIADELSCDTTTITRNKARLINRLAVYLYNSEASFDLG